MESYEYDNYEGRALRFSFYVSGEAYGGGHAGKIMDMWRKKLSALEDNVKESIYSSVSQCKEEIQDLCLDLLINLKDLEYKFGIDYSDDDSHIKKFTQNWIKKIKYWRDQVYQVDCRQKKFLTDIIHQHCDFLTKLNQFHPEYIKWKISRIIMEANRIINLNEEAFSQTETKLMIKQNSLLKSQHKEDMSALEDIAEFEESQTLNDLYDEEELDEQKKRRENILIDPIHIKANSSLLATLKWLEEIRQYLNTPLATFKCYDPSNRDQVIAVEHLENCKNTILNSAISFIDLIEPHIKEELVNIGDITPEAMSDNQRIDVERWLECVSFFEFSLDTTIKFIKGIVHIWSQHASRLKTVCTIIQDILKHLHVEQNKLQLKIELKINSILDGIREASNHSDIDNNMKNLDRNFSELEKLYAQICETGKEEIKELLAGCQLSRKVFMAQINICLSETKEDLEYPGHGSEIDIPFDPISDLHHWELIKQSFKTNSNWYQGLVEGVTLLVKVEKEGWELFWEDGLNSYLTWVKDIKEQALERRKERIHADLIVPRIMELESHQLILQRHTLGLNNIFAKKNKWLDDFKCSLLSMTAKLMDEYEALINYKKTNDAYHRNRYVGRINKFEEELQKTEQVKISLLDSHLEKIGKRFFWLKKANYGILKSIRLFNEGGSFSSSEATEYSNKIKILHETIISVEKDAVDELNNIDKLINPTKGIDIKVLSAIKKVIHYKTKKDSVEESVSIILDKMKENVKKELLKARKFCSELCDIISCYKSYQNEILDFLTRIAFYFKYPEESSLLECENLNYRKDCDDDNYKDEEICEESSKESLRADRQKKDCKELFQEAEELISGIRERKDQTIATDEADKNQTQRQNSVTKDGESKKGKKSKIEDDQSDYVDNSLHSSATKIKKYKTKEQNNFRENKIKKSGVNAIEIERKNVLRDTKCEQDRRKTLQEEMEKEQLNRESLENYTSSQMLTNKKSDKKRNSKQKGKGSSKKLSKDKFDKEIDGAKKNSGDKYEHIASNEDFIDYVLETDPNNFLFKYTKVPIETKDCNFLLLTKKIIYEHYLEINIVAEKFYLSKDVLNMRKISKDISPMSDYRSLTTHALKIMRNLNIHCEHAWIVLTHDFLCLFRALHCIGEENAEKEIELLEHKWKNDFKYICSATEVALNQALVVKTHKAAQLVNKFKFTDCLDVGNLNNAETLNNDLRNHCSQHIDDIKHIWSKYAENLSTRYTYLKKGFSDLSDRMEFLRNTISNNENIKLFLCGIRIFGSRYDEQLCKVFKGKCSTESNINSADNSNTDNQKTSEDYKLKLLQTLITAMLMVVDDLNEHYFESTSMTEPLGSKVIPEMCTRKINVKQKGNNLLFEILASIKLKLGSFKHICNDQIGITEKWLENWQNNIN